ncbi:MAG: DUF169 domain-containing protein [Clostridia bacterium]|nr:DUF169 domain-containing protein [Clostridia bacterium]
MRIKENAEKLYGLLPLERRIVGVQMIEKREAYDAIKGQAVVKPMPYCVAVKSAMEGHSVKIDCIASSCPGGSRALGLTPATSDYYNGSIGVAMGLYKNESIASNVATSVLSGKPDTYGVHIKPLELFADEPDIVLIALNAKNAMRLLQGYTYRFGVAKNISCSGSQSVCVECTMSPYSNGDINISMLGSSTRHHAAWKEEELMVGINYKVFEAIVDGVEKTVNAVESDVDKARIEKSLKATKTLEIDVEYGKTYYSAY